MALVPFTREALAAMFGDILKDLLAGLVKEAGEGGRSFLAERVQRSIAERREDLITFLEKMRGRGGKYQKAADHFFSLLKKWQRDEAPGVENKRVKNLAELYGAFDPPPRPIRPERPTIPAGKGGTVSSPALEAYQQDLEDYKQDLRAYEEVARTRSEARLEFFKRLGLQSEDEIEAILEGVNDDGFWQMFVGRPVYELKRASHKVGKAAKKTLRATDATASKAAIPLGRLADWIDNQP